MAIIKRETNKGISYRVQLRPSNQSSISKTFKSKKDAEFFESRMKVELFMNHNEDNLRLEMTFNELVDTFFYFRNNKNYIKSTEYKIKNFIHKYGEFKLKKFYNPLIFENYIEYERSNNLQDSSIKIKMNSISLIFNFALKNKWIYKHPMENVTKLKFNESRKRRIDDFEINRILEHLKFDTKSLLSKENYNSKQATAILFLLALETGMRKNEIANIKFEDINYKEKIVKLHKTKNGTSRDVPLSSKAIKLFKKLDFEKPNSCKRNNIFGYSNNTLNSLFCRSKNKLGIQDLHFHDTRHEAISKLSKKLPILALGYMVGHKDLQSLWFYYNPKPSEIAELLN